MAKYICSDCYKEVESDQKPEYCPNCGAGPESIQIIEEVNINDEMQITMSNLNLLLRLLDAYVDKVKSINNEYANKQATMKKNHSDQLKNCEDKHKQAISRIDYEKNNVLEKWERDYRSTLNKEAKEAEKYKKEQDDVTSNSRKYRDDIQRRADNDKKRIENIMKSVTQAEAHIIPKKYHKLAKSQNPPMVTVDAKDMAAINAMNPKKMADEINALYEKFIRRIIKASELYQKYIEFYSMRKKAEELYAKEKTQLNSMLPDSDAKARRMIDEARRKYNFNMSQHQKDAEKNKQLYLDGKRDVTNKYEKQRQDEMANHVVVKKNLLAQQSTQLAELETQKRQALIQSYENMQKNVLAKVSPQQIADAVKNQKSRAKTLRNNFTLANNEPENITIGSMEYKLDKILGNRLVSKFMTENYQAVINGNSFVFPFTIGLNQNLCLYFKYNNDQSNVAKDSIQTICLNAFLSTPPNKMRFHFFDPLKSGQSFAVFKHFEDDLSRSYNVILGGIQTDSSSIEKQLQIIVDHIKNMQVNTFKGQYKNIRDYNAANTLNPQPYNIVGIMDFPAGFTSKSVDLLQQIVATGKECGVYAVIMCNTDNLTTVDARIQNQIKNIEDIATVYEHKQKGFYLHGKNGIDNNMIFSIDSPLSVQKIVTYAPIMRQGIKDAGRIIIDYKHIAPPIDKRFKYNSDEGLMIPIGMSGASDIQYLTLGRPGSQSVHALIAGQIGSGKSRLLHAIITSAILQYPKEELELYLVDFKSGTEFKIYADYNLPNFRVIAIESEQEFGRSVLQFISSESDRRSQLFNNNSVSDITSYNKTQDAQRKGKLPRILLVVDEFHELFNSSNPEISKESERLLDNLLRLKRSYGVHVILCTQSVRGLSAVSEGAMAQIAVRIALKCPKEDADILLGEGSDSMAQIEENDAGSAIYLPAISEPKTNNKFRVGFISPEAHNDVLKEIEKHYKQLGIGSTNTRVLVSDVADSRDSVFQEYLKHDNLIVEHNKVHFGESLNIDRSLAVTFNNRRNDNLLLAGKNSSKANNLLLFITIDLILQSIYASKHGMQPAKIFLFNFSNEYEDVMDNYLSKLSMMLPDYIEGADSYEALDKLEEAYNLYKSNSDENVWVIINNLGLANDFQNAIYSSSSQGFNMLEDMLRNGPEHGTHIIAWHNDLTLFRQKFPNIIDLFGKRIAFDMSDEDALNFADIVKDPSINKNNAVFYETGRGKQKFRPYSTPTNDWFEHMVNKISSEDIF